MDNDEKYYLEEIKKLNLRILYLEKVVEELQTQLNERDYVHPSIDNEDYEWSFRYG